MGDGSTRHERWDALIVELSTDPALRRGELDATIARITEVGARELGVARSSVWLFDPDRSAIRCRDLWDGRTHGAGLVLAKRDFPAYFAAMTSHRILAADDAHRDPRTCEFSASYLGPLGIGAMLDAPVRAQGQLAGVLCHEHVGGPRVWSIDEQMFAASLADLVAQALSSAQVHHPEPVFADLTGEHELGRYELIAQLGRGGMAEVFLAIASRRSKSGQAGNGAESVVTGPEVAVLKRIRGTLAEDRDVIVMLRDEANVATRLSHPNVVRTLEVGEWKDSTFIVMELLEGPTVSAIMARGEPVPTNAWARILCDALAGLHYAHEARDENGKSLDVVHRDVSPQNLMVTYEGVTKVLDFGIAKTTLERERTATGVLKGRLGYMAPEHYELGAVDRRADVYSVGVVAWEMLTGARFRDTRSMRAMLKTLRDPPPGIRAIAPSVPEAVEAVILRALAPTPSDRWPTAEAMRVALESAIPLAPRVELGELLSLRFGAERAALQRLIRAHVDTQRGPRSKN